jgi:hypothetical protein
MVYNLSTEDLNSYGFWVLTSGIDLDRYEGNPVITLNHDTYEMSVGKMNGTKKENSALIGEPEFDEGDDIGKRLKRKYEKGYMNGFSIGIRVIEWSEDTKFIKPGQTRATVVKSELMETAAATVPSNSSAIRLYDADGSLINLSQVNLNTIVPEIQKNDIPTINKNGKSMKKIALSLGLPETATEQEINAKIAELQAKKETEKNAPETGNLAELFLSLGTSKGVINDKNKEDFKELYDLNPTLAVKMLSHMEVKKEEKPANTETPKTETLTSLIEKFGNQGQAKTEKKWADLSEKEAEELRENNKAEYVKLFTAHYGFEPKI